MAHFDDTCFERDGVGVSLGDESVVSTSMVSVDQGYGDALAFGHVAKVGWR